MAESAPHDVAITGDPDIDHLNSTNALSLVLGMMLDQQYGVEHAFRGGWKVLSRVGTLDTDAIAAAEPAEFKALCSDTPAIHRFPGSMAGRFQELAAHIEANYEGDVARKAALAVLADIVVVLDTGPEVITGSTRMKAGTATKLALNSSSTALMIRLGHTYSNLMVDMVATNTKLRGRTIRIIEQATGASAEQAEAALSACGDIKTAVVYLLAGLTADSGGAARAAAALSTAGGFVRGALDIVR